MARTHQQFIQDVEHRNTLCSGFPISIKKGQVYCGLDYDMVFLCGNKHGEFTTKPRYIIQKHSGCPVCKNAKISNTAAKDLNTFVSQLQQIAPHIKLVAGQKYINTDSKMNFLCKVGHKFTTVPKTILQSHGCSKCANISRRKKLSHTVYDDGTTGDIQAEIDKIIQGTTLNVVVVPTHQAYDKYQYATLMDELRQTQHTIMLFEDEWLDNRELITKKLEHYANSTNVTQQIHARKCVIRVCSPSEKRGLLDEHHVQGNDNAQINYGAYYNDILIAVMTFCRPRVSVGHKGQYTGMWELSRFCTDTNYRIPGIASKLLKHFQRNNQWTEIYSYADKRWSVGNMYQQLGFTLTADNPPGYFYVVDGKRKHRWNYRKDVIKNTLPNYDPNLTEQQNMTNHGFWRVWDCGTLKFTLNNTVV
jgi:hypothetical protein